MKLEKKLIFLIAGIVGFILMLILVFWLMNLASDKTLSYDSIEEKMISATKNYAEDKTNILPTANDEVFTIDVKDLIKAEYMEEFSEYLGEDSKVKCSGEVTIYYTDGIYSYVPLLDCGEDHKTKYLFESIIKNTVSSGDGLYQVIDGKFTTENIAGENMKYIYRGENPNNYIMLGEYLWRIVEVTGNNDIVVIRDEPEIKVAAWDDRYNTENDKNFGINDYEKSRVHDYLENTYTNLSSDIKALLTSMNLCVDAKANDAKAIDLTTACQKYEEDQYIGLLTANDYTLASLDTKCISIMDKSCGNYNYLSSIKETWWLLTPDTTNSYSVYYIEDMYVNTAYAKSRYNIRPIIQLGKRAIISTGKGTETDPYIVK